MNDPSSSDSIRREIAATAARLVADGGLDYASAKRKAARQLLGEGNSARRQMPDNELVDLALREHLELFDAGHGDRVARRRGVALALMQLLAPFTPYLTGAVWKGIVAEHAPIHVQTFHDNPKEVAYALLEHHIAFDASTMPHFRHGGDIETLSFFWRDEPCLVSLYDPVDLRGALRVREGQAERGNLVALTARIESDRD